MLKNKVKRNDGAGVAAANLDGVYVAKIGYSRFNL